MLYVLHRDQLYEQDMHVTRATKADLEQVEELIKSSGAEDDKCSDLMKQLTNSVNSFASGYLAYCARID